MELLLMHLSKIKKTQKDIKTFFSQKNLYYMLM